MTWKPAVPGEDAHPFPVETLRHWYVTPFGGMSPELRFYQVGINRECLERNTSLNPETDRVRVSVVGRWRRPLLMDRVFEVVPLDESLPKAFAHSPRGEAVLPEADEILRPQDAPRPGDDVLLNSVVSQRSGGIASPDEFERVLRELLRRAREDDSENS